MERFDLSASLFETLTVGTKSLVVLGSKEFRLKHGVAVKSVYLATKLLTGNVNFGYTAIPSPPLEGLPKLDRGLSPPGL